MHAAADFTAQRLPVHDAGHVSPQEVQGTPELNLANDLWVNRWRRGSLVLGVGVLKHTLKEGVAGALGHECGSSIRLETCGWGWSRSDDRTAPGVGGSLTPAGSSTLPWIRHSDPLLGLCLHTQPIDRVETFTPPLDTHRLPVDDAGHVSLQEVQGAPELNLANDPRVNRWRRGSLALGVGVLKHTLKEGVAGTLGHGCGSSISLLIGGWGWSRSDDRTAPGVGGSDTPAGSSTLPWIRHSDPLLGLCLHTQPIDRVETFTPPRCEALAA